MKVPVSGTDCAYLTWLRGLSDHSDITSLNIRAENLESSGRSMILNMYNGLEQGISNPRALRKH